MYCSKCGSELPPGASFCAQCGSRVWQQPDAPNRAAQPQQQSSPNPYSAAPGSMGQNETSSRFSPPRPDSSNPFGGTPGGMGQNHSYAPSVSRTEDQGYAKTFEYNQARLISNVVGMGLFLIFFIWLCQVMESSDLGRHDREKAILFLIIVIICYTIYGVYSTLQIKKIRLQVGTDGIMGAAGMGIKWFIGASVEDIMIRYKDIDDVGVLFNANSGAIKILARGNWLYFPVRNGQEALDLIRQRWQAAKR